MIENNKLFYQTYDAFQSALQSGQINRSAIVFIKDEQLIWTHDTFFGEKEKGPFTNENYVTWDALDRYALSSDLEGLATKNELNDYVKSEDLIGINQETLETIQQLRELLEDNSDIQSLLELISSKADKSELDAYSTKEELNAYMTKAEYDDITNPMSVRVTASPSLIEYDGQSHNVTITCTVTKKGATVQPSNVNISINNASVSNSTPYTAHLQNEGRHTISAVATYNGKSATATATVNIVRPTYIGFGPSNVDLQTLSKSVITSISMSKQMSNDVSGNYLWIVTPHTVNTVATDNGFTYTVDMQDEGVTNGLHYYRSVLGVDVSVLTYYIK